MKSLFSISVRMINLLSYEDPLL